MIVREVTLEEKNLCATKLGGTVFHRTDDKTGKSYIKYLKSREKYINQVINLNHDGK